MKLIVKLIKELQRICKGFGILFCVKYVGYIFLNINTVLRKKSLGIVDTKIHGNVHVKALGNNFELLDDMMPTIREVLLKNCYGYDTDIHYLTTIDLGANRGVFSVIAAKCSDRVISVECNKSEFSAKYQSVMAMNSVNNTHLVNKFAASYADETHVNLNQIVKDFNLTEISYLKVDIEGAESDLFSANLEWLTITKEISMEVHPCFNVDTQKIYDTLDKSGFKLRCYDLDVRQISDFTGVSMGYLRASR